MATATPTIKPGYKTTEFWLSAVAMTLGALYASGLIHDGGTVGKVAGLVVSFLGALGYTVSRTLAKK